MKWLLRKNRMSFLENRILPKDSEKRDKNFERTEK